MYSERRPSEVSGAFLIRLAFPLKRREPSVSPAAARITLHEHSRRPEGGAASCLPGFDAGKTNPPTRCGVRACPSIRCWSLYLKVTPRPPSHFHLAIGGTRLTA